jgi:hypothetical protein
VLILHYTTCSLGGKKELKMKEFQIVKKNEGTEKNIKIWEPPTFTNFSDHWMNNRRFAFFFTIIDVFPLTLVWGVQLFNQPCSL